MITNINGAGPFLTISKYTEQHGENVSIMLTPQANDILAWAEKKMADEKRWAELAKNNVAVADAVEALKTAREQLEIVIGLTS